MYTAGIIGASIGVFLIFRANGKSANSPSSSLFPLCKDFMLIPSPRTPSHYDGRVPTTIQRIPPIPKSQPYRESPFPGARVPGRKGWKADDDSPVFQRKTTRAREWSSKRFYHTLCRREGGEHRWTVVELRTDGKGTNGAEGCRGGEKIAYTYLHVSPSTLGYAKTNNRIFHFDKLLERFRRCNIEKGGRQVLLTLLTTEAEASLSLTSLDLPLCRLCLKMGER